MFTKTKSKLDKAVALSIAAMLACNVVVLSQQLTAAPHFAANQAASVSQA